jgi:hypothetical protein
LQPQVEPTTVNLDPASVHELVAQPDGLPDLVEHSVSERVARSRVDLQGLGRQGQVAAEYLLQWRAWHLRGKPSSGWHQVAHEAPETHLHGGKAQHQRTSQTRVGVLPASARSSCPTGILRPAWSGRWTLDTRSAAERPRSPKMPARVPAHGQTLLPGLPVQRPLGDDLRKGLCRHFEPCRHRSNCTVRRAALCTACTSVNSASRCGGSTSSGGHPDPK